MTKSTNKIRTIFTKFKRLSGLAYQAKNKPIWCKATWQ